MGLDFSGGLADIGGMDISLSTQMAQSALFDQVNSAVAKKGLDQQKIDGQNTLQLIESGSVPITDPTRGQNINVLA